MKSGDTPLAANPMQMQGADTMVLPCSTNPAGYFRWPLVMQGFDCLGIGGHDLQQRFCRPGGPGAPLLPVLQGAQVDADQAGELALADLRGLADGAHIGCREFADFCAANGFARDMALHGFYAFEQLVEMLLIHF